MLRSYAGRHDPSRRHEQCDANLVRRDFAEMAQTLPRRFERLKAAGASLSLRQLFYLRALEDHVHCVIGCLAGLILSCSSRVVYENAKYYFPPLLCSESHPNNRWNSDTCSQITFSQHVDGRAGPHVPGGEARVATLHTPRDIKLHNCLAQRKT